MPSFGVFLQPDTIVPDYSNPQGLNRFAYVYNNPLRYTDPSGHAPAGTQVDQAQFANNLSAAIANLSDDAWVAENAPMLSMMGTMRLDLISMYQSMLDQVIGTLSDATSDNPGADIEAKVWDSLPDVGDYTRTEYDAATGSRHQVTDLGSYGRDFREAISSNPALKLEAKKHAAVMRKLPVIGPMSVALPEVLGQSVAGDDVGTLGRIASGIEVGLGVSSAWGLGRSVFSGSMHKGLESGSKMLAATIMGDLRSRESYNRSMDELNAVQADSLQH